MTLNGQRKPRVYVLCGSTRFPDAFALANMHLSIKGHIVIGLGMMGHADIPTGARFFVSDGDETNPIKQAVDQLHFRKIDLADVVYVVNPGGYVGSSTRREILYGHAWGKPIQWMFGTDPMWSTHAGRTSHDPCRGRGHYCTSSSHPLEPEVAL